MKYFTSPDINCCAQHIEVKEQFNGLFNKSLTLSEKLSVAAISTPFNELRFNAIAANVDKVETELANIKRGLSKCCYPY